MRTCIKLRANTERDLSSKRSGWFLMLWSKVVLVLFVSGIRVVCQSQCFCRQAHNHHKDILSLQTGWKPTQSYMSCPTKLHTKGFKVSAGHQGWPSPCWPLLVVNIIHQTSFLFYSLLCIEWKAPATDFKIAPKLDIRHNNGGVFVSDKSLHSSCFLDESPDSRRKQLQCLAGYLLVHPCLPALFDKTRIISESGLTLWCLSFRLIIVSKSQGQECAAMLAAIWGCTCRHNGALS